MRNKTSILFPVNQAAGLEALSVTMEDCEMCPLLGFEGLYCAVYYHWIREQLLLYSKMLDSANSCKGVLVTSLLLWYAGSK